MHHVRLFIFSAAVAVTAVGCGGTSQTSVIVQAGGSMSDSSALSAHDAQWSSDPLLRQKVTVNLVPGWRLSSPDTYRNDRLKETVSVAVGRSHRSVIQEMVILCERQSGFGFLCGTGELFDDARVGTFRFHRVDVAGQVVVAHFGEDASCAVFFVGLWPAANEKEAQAAFEQLVESVEFNRE